MAKRIFLVFLVFYASLGIAQVVPTFVLSSSICITGTTNVTASTGTTVATGYTWTASPAAVFGSANAASTSITYPAPGIYTITLTVASGTATGAVSNTIAVIPNPVIVCNSSLNLVCLGNSSTLTATGPPLTTFNWSPSTGLSSTSGGTVILTPGVPSTVIVTGTSAGCTGTCAVTVSVSPAPSIGITANPGSVICPGGSTSLTATGGLSYTWSPSTGLSSTTGSLVVASPLTNQFYTLTGIDAAGCTGTTSINVTIGPPLTITVTPAGTSTTCVGGSPITYTALGAASYVWSPASGLSVAFGPLVTATPSVTTTYTVLGSTGTCTGQAVVTVSVLTAPILTVTPTSGYLCFGATTNFTASGASTYTWSPAATLSSNTGSMVTASPTVNPVSYTVVGQSAQGCLTLPKVVTLTVIPIPTQTIGLQTNTLGVVTNSICSSTLSNPTFTIGFTSPVAPPGFAFTYSIAPYTTSLATVLGPSSVAAPGAFTIAPSVPAVQSTITYSLFTFYTGMQGCISKADTVTIRILNCNPPVASFTTASKNDTICTRGCITFINTTTGGNPQTLLWNFPGGKPNTSTSTFPVICYNVPGTYTVDLTVTNPYGGPSFVVKNKYIVVVDTPNTKAPNDTCIRFGKSLTLKGSLAGSYVWSGIPTGPISCTYCCCPIVSPTVNTQYIVTGYNSKKCHYNDTVNVCVIQDCGDMFVPNAFSPNKDGVNDLLFVRGHCLQNMVFQVFNRWGEVVWETHDPLTKGWDGTYNGDLMNTGVFVFRLTGTTIDNEPYSLKGNVTLIR